MNRNYYIKKGDQSDIYLKVDVSTQGSADTFVYKRRSGGTSELLAESPKFDGNIKRRIIAKADTIAESVLEIITMINLGNVPKENWQAAYDNLSIDYRMEGGADGIQDFEYDKDDKAKSKDGQFIVVSKPVRIITLN